MADKGIVRDKNVRGLVMDIMMGVLEANSCIINEMARAIDMNPWTLHKRIQRFERYCDDREVDMDYYKIALKIAKKEYRACRFIFVIVDYTSIYGALGVGLMEPKNKGEMARMGFDMLGLGVLVGN